MPFNWYTFFSESGSEVAPAHLFKHIEKSIEPNFLAGHTLEVELSISPEFSGLSTDGIYCWPCEVVLSNEKSIYIRWCFPYESKAHSLNEAFELFKHFFKTSVICSSHQIPAHHGLPFWLSLNEKTWNSIHPLGWSENHNILWHLPFSCDVNMDNISPKKCMWHKTEWGRMLLKRSVPKSFFESRSVCVNGLIQVGGFLECQLEKNPTHVWLVKILKNCGGRITVAWFGVNAKFNPNSNAFYYSNNFDTLTEEPAIFSLYFLHPRIHQLGWGLSKGYTYKPPIGYQMHNPPTITEEFLEHINHGFPNLKNAKDSNMGFFYHNHPIFGLEPPIHSFHEGIKLEAMHSSKPYGSFPATIVKILSDRYFVVQFDDLRNSSDVLCDNNTISTFINQNRLQANLCSVPSQFVANLSMPQIMPPNMSQHHGLKLFPPLGWPLEKPFNWNIYLSFMTDTSKTGDFNKLDTISPQTTISLIPSSDLNFRTPGEQSLLNFLSVPTARFLSNKSTIIDSSSDSCLYGRQAEPKVVSHILNNNETKLILPKAVNTGPTQLKEFFVGMKLELVLPSSLWNYHIGHEFVDAPLCAATIIRVQAGMVWLLPDLPAAWQMNKMRPDTPIMIECTSTEIYPVGWCQNVNHPFIPPICYCSSSDFNYLPNKIKNTYQMLCVPDPISPIIECLPYYVGLNSKLASTSSGTVEISGIYDNSDICPPIYINGACYPGPYICKSSLDTLPRQFGPGPVVRVMQNLITRLITAAYKPIPVLRLFEADWATNLTIALAGNSRAGLVEAIRTSDKTITAMPSNIKQAMSDVAELRHEDMSLVIVRVRCPRRGVKVEAPVEVVKKRRAVEEFCRQISLLLEGCPFLISTRQYLSSSASRGSSEVLVTDGQPIPCPIFCHSLIRPRRLDRLLGPRRRVYNFSARLFDGSFQGRPLYNWNPERLNNESNNTEGSNGSSASSVRTRSTRSTRPINILNDDISSTDPNLPRKRRADLSMKRYVARLRPVSARKQAEAAARSLDQSETTNTYSIDEIALAPRVHLDTNPMEWTAEDVAAYLATTDCHELWPWLAAEAVDGQAFMLLSVSVLHSLKGLCLDAAVRLARHVVSVKRAFLEQFCHHNNTLTQPSASQAKSPAASSQPSPAKQIRHL